MIERYCIPSYGASSDKKALTMALLLSVKVAKELQCPITLCVPALCHAETSILNNFFKPRLLRNLVKGKICKLDNHITNMISTQTMNSFNIKGVIVGLWASKKMLIKIDKAKHAKAVITVPWIKEDADVWVRKWAPIKLLPDDF